ncbi:hypothetical protein BOW49_11300 [Solemya velum gill symbiont]|uniref:hypothetical protein n=1 Tax=Solemya velum gill symbiont TaxID=2340 RepID=UPI000996C665|nr:hypothetical protein [Solemya velum gill symbiont]OOZ72179.1 hypothetical protein BOW49_11300 [Solemya velum gill symbiont]
MSITSFLLALFCVQMLSNLVGVLLDTDIVSISSLQTDTISINVKQGIGLGLAVAMLSLHQFGAKVRLLEKSQSSLFVRPGFYVFLALALYVFYMLRNYAYLLVIPDDKESRYIYDLFNSNFSMYLVMASGILYGLAVSENKVAMMIGFITVLSLMIVTAVIREISGPPLLISTPFVWLIYSYLGKAVNASAWARGLDYDSKQKLVF